MRWLLKVFLACIVMGAGAFYFLTAPARLDHDYGNGLIPDLAAGRMVFAAGGCVSCHAAPGSKDTDRLVLSGGLAFASDFGTFFAPNISPDQQHGIGGWSLEEFARALTRGVSPDGQHYYPAFPYTAYGHLVPQDVTDLFGYLQSLPGSDIPSKSHDVAFPFNLRRGLGLWKKLFRPNEFALIGDIADQVARGRYLAEGLAHCGECHTPRNAVGGLKRDHWLAGAPNPSGKGKIPNITPAALEWSEADLVEYFTSGFTPDYDSVGDEMVEVVDNLAQLPASDRAAIAAYLKAIPAIR